MENQNQNDEKNVMLSILAGIGIGALVGAVAGLLLAPKAGSETRQNIGDTLSGLGDRISDLSDQVASRFRSAVDAGKHAMSERGVGRSGREGGGESTS
jgi:gas vesicle protein